MNDLRAGAGDVLERMKEPAGSRGRLGVELEALEGDEPETEKQPV